MIIDISTEFHSGDITKSDLTNAESAFGHVINFLEDDIVAAPAGAGVNPRPGYSFGSAKMPPRLHILSEGFDTTKQVRIVLRTAAAVAPAVNTPSRTLPYNQKDPGGTVTLAGTVAQRPAIVDATVKASDLEKGYSIEIPRGLAVQQFLQLYLQGYDAAGAAAAFADSDFVGTTTKATFNAQLLPDSDDWRPYGQAAGVPNASAYTA